jgi:hypothetical protein
LILSCIQTIESGRIKVVWGGEVASCMKFMAQVGFQYILAHFPRGTHAWRLGGQVRAILVPYPLLFEISFLTAERCSKKGLACDI